MFTFLKHIKDLLTIVCQVSRSYYIPFILITVVSIGGGWYFWIHREFIPEAPLPIHSSLPPVDEISGNEAEKESGEEDESEDEENMPVTGSPWTLLKTALPSRYYEPSVNTERPSIALVLTGLGLEKAWTDHVLTTLKRKSTFVFSPYSSNLEAHLQQAANSGHQVLIALPMESYNFPNPDSGPLTVLTGVKAEENIEKMKAVLGKVPKGTGIIGEYGSRFTASQPDLEPVLKEIKNRGSLFIDPNSSLYSQVQPTCAALNMTCHKVDLTLPLSTHSTELNEFFKKIIQSAKENGTIIVSVPAIPAFIDYLLEWTDTLEKNGINFVTIADLKTPELSLLDNAREQGTTDARKPQAHQPR